MWASKGENPDTVSPVAVHFAVEIFWWMAAVVIARIWLGGFWHPIEMAFWS